MSEAGMHARVNEAAITLLMPVYNRAPALEAVLPSYLNQAHLAKIVLVDDGSTDATPQVMESFRKQSAIPIEIIRHPERQGQPLSRLSALAAAETEWVLFGEDDVYFAPDYARVLLEQARQLDAAMVAGRRINIWIDHPFTLADLEAIAQAKTVPQQVACDLAIFSGDFDATGTAPVRLPFLHTNALIRRDIFARVTFDPGYRGNAVREETDFYLGAGAAGYSMYFAPETACYHLRGPIAATGGQRTSRLQMEFWNIVNTRRLVVKHWPHLRNELGFGGTPARWLAGYIWQRYAHVLRHVFRTGSLRAKDRT